ncbi:hypothetical protein F1C15_15085 [Frigoribacterium sp. NBH87]|uniref:hypothetical protein n=1 Tax=Frigoribacterium sp. NBH87 TaxID=2596916 RepID=UPI0016233F6C|nr:hypothetical protein [Frigoribacterium sp. NBH87]QNE44963.1 hypothetical protein F1C15_15085 [Frigoribacterium sp. NBH87]
MSTIATYPSPITLQYTAEDGSQPLVVTTPNEYLSEVIARMKALGGSANIALAKAKSFQLGSLEYAGESEEFAGVDVVNHDMSMGMLFMKLERGTLGPFTVRAAGVTASADVRAFAYAA